MTEHLSVLISDTSPAAADSVVNVLVRAGFSRSRIYHTKSFKSAIKHIEEHRPDFLITEFSIDGHSGLELISLLSEKNPHKMSMLVTHNNATSAIAEAAEELVDDYLIKPILAVKLEDRIRSLVEKRFSPSKYLEEIRKGKQFLQEEQYQAAHARFKNAIDLHEQPTLAYYYLGQTHHREKNFDDALTGYQNGLSIRPLHFRCLAGLFDTYFEQRRFEEAYNLAAKLITYYPIGAKRLCNLFVAAVYAKKMEDVPKYYDLFLKLHNVTPELRRVFSGALLVAGMFHINRQDVDKAVYCFNCGLQVIGPDLLYLDKVIRSLASGGPEMATKGEGFLRRFPNRNVGGMEHSVLSYLLGQYRETPAQLIAQGRQLIQKNYLDIDCFRLLIRTLLIQQKDRMAEDYYHKGRAVFPELEVEFGEKFT